MTDRSLIEQLDQAIDGILAGSEQTKSADDPTLSALIGIAGTLRDLPDDGFKTRLGLELGAAQSEAEFQRRTPMTAPTPLERTESSTPEFVTIDTVTPFICVAEGAKLIDFMKHTFGAQETTDRKSVV